MMNKKGFTLVELMVVVTIIPVLMGIAIPMYNADVNRRSLQEAVDTLGAIRDGVVSYAADNGVPPPSCADWSDILNYIGVQCPLSLGPAGGRKWVYRTIDNTSGGAADGTYVVRATGGLAGDIGSVLEAVVVYCVGTWDAGNGVFTDWAWGSPDARVDSWLPD